jgi:hypothetical protein
VIDGTMRVFQCDSNGTFLLTDSTPIIAGVASVNIELLSQPYSYDVVIDGVLYSDANSYSKCHIESLTEITYYVRVRQEILSDQIGFQSIDCKLNKSGTNAVIMEWEQNSQDSSYVPGCIEIYRRSLNNVLVYKNCSVESEGYSRKVVLPLTGNQYTVTGKLTQANMEKICSEPITFLQADDAATAFGITGLISAIFLTLGIILIWIGQGVMSLFAAGIGVSISYVLGLLILPWTALAAIIGFLVVIAIVGRYSGPK